MLINRTYCSSAKPLGLAGVLHKFFDPPSLMPVPDLQACWVRGDALGETKMVTL